jgi:hypothetical protein
MTTPISTPVTSSPGTGPITPEQRTAARAVGELYLVLMATGMFAQVYVPGGLSGGADEILGNERLLRAGTAVEVLTFAGDACLAVAYYTLLRPVSRPLAMVGAFLRLAQVSVLTAYSLANIVVLELLTGGVDRADALTRATIDAHDAGYAIGFTLLGLGSTVFAVLLYRSRYVPRVLAGLGVVASPLLALGSLATLVFPGTTDVVNPALYVPMFLFEVGTGLWLLLRGIR